MASAKELKNRIRAVQETKKITNAMYLISSTKLRRARADLTQTQPYFEALRAAGVRLPARPSAPRLSKRCGATNITATSEP